MTKKSARETSVQTDSYSNLHLQERGVRAQTRMHEGTIRETRHQACIVCIGEVNATVRATTLAPLKVHEVMACHSQNTACKVCLRAHIHRACGVQAAQDAAYHAGD